MSKRHKKSDGEQFFENIADLASMLPLWFTIPTAVLLFVFVPFDLSNTTFTTSSNVSLLVVGILFNAICKYMIPAALVTGAIVRVLLRLKSTSLFSDIKKHGAADVITKLSWQDFEFLLSEHFKKQGFSTELTGGGGADGGIDIKLYKNDEIYLVQCKHYKTWKVSVQIVRELFGIITAENAAGGYVVTSGRFTKDAYTFAKGKNIHLIDGKDLVQLLDITEVKTVQNKVATSKICPKCSGLLVQRSGKYGKFFGCSNYPKCKYTSENK